MSDIRRINLDQKPAQNVKSVPAEEFRLGAERLSELERLLPELIKLDYWSPEFQAWEPFVTAYLQSGVASQLAAVWLPRFSRKIEEIGPNKSKFHNIFAEVMHMTKAVSVECFADYSWEEITEFVDWIPTYIDNRKTINKFLFDTERYNGLLDSMLKRKEASAGYSENLAYAVYLYRHCMFDYEPYKPQTIDELKAQLSAYTTDFEKTFTVVSGFIGENSDVYKWYTLAVKKIISKAWTSSLDLTSNRSVITAGDVFNMPVWLSEQLTDYVASLPCTYTVTPDPLFILDALEYALSKEASFEDPQMIYAFCVPKSYLKNFIDRLSMFYWDVKEGRFVSQLRAMVSAQYTKSVDGEAKTPEEYDEELRSRGFPLEVDNNE